MEKYHIRCRAIYHVAKNIFGNIVKSAYIEYWDKSELQNRSKKYKDLKEDSDIISYDSDTIVIQFTNDKLVSFTNSEWASISSLKKLNLV